MVTRYLSFLLITLLIITSLGFIGDSGKIESEGPCLQNDTWVYTFQSDDIRLLKNAKPHKFSAGTLVEDVLDSLGCYMANTYFFKVLRNDTTNISFDVLTIREIPVPGRPLRIAIIDMKDTKQFAMGYFFQGSTGGAVTFYMLGATFLQPQWDPPLLDGLMILYNGAQIKELDHINLKGLLVPRMVRNKALRAIDTPWEENSSNDKQ